MKAFLVAVLLVAGSPAAAADKTYDIAGFDRIEVSRGVQVIVTEGRDFHIEADAKRGNIRRLVVRKRGDTLEIRRRTPLGILGFARRDRFVVRVALPDLTGVASASGSNVEVDGDGTGDLDLDANSGARLFFDGRRGGDLTANASSGADLEARGIVAGQVVASSSSGASLELEGTCDEIEASASSGASLDAHGLDCKEATAESSSGASLSVHATRAIVAEARHGSSLTVTGNPEDREVESSGGASITVRR